MKEIIISFLLFSSVVTAYEAVNLKYPPDFIFNQVLKTMSIKKDSHILSPVIVYAKDINLQNFQNEVEPQWGLKPDFITNVYLAYLNKIYLLDEKSYYEQNGRCIDDSLAHELVHFVQVKYRNIPIQYFDDSMEMEAIDIQSRFRDEFCR